MNNKHIYSKIAVVIQDIESALPKLLIACITCAAIGCATCHCPECPTTATPVSTATSDPTPPESASTATVASADTLESPVLPEKLGSPTKTAPASLEDFLQIEKLVHASFDRFQEAVSTIEGARVRWNLLSWGGEITTEKGYNTPSGVQPLSIGRIRLVTATLPNADLIGIEEAGHPVVACLAQFPDDGGAVFVQSDGHRASAPASGLEFTIEAAIWGATREGGGATLWLHDCEVAEP